MGWGCGERLAQKHCCRAVVNGYHPCSGRDDGEEFFLDNESLYSVLNLVYIQLGLKYGVDLK